MEVTCMWHVTCMLPVTWDMWHVTYIDMCVTVNWPSSRWIVVAHWMTPWWRRWGCSRTLPASLAPAGRSPEQEQHLELCSNILKLLDLYLHYCWNELQIMIWSWLFRAATESCVALMIGKLKYLTWNFQFMKLDIKLEGVALLVADPLSAKLHHWYWYTCL